jgi:hypothetical protein
LLLGAAVDFSEQHTRSDENSAAIFANYHRVTVEAVRATTMTARAFLVIGALARSFAQSTNEDFQAMTEAQHVLSSVAFFANRTV